MGNVLKTIAIIPARGGSKRIPEKNIQLFIGLPLLVHSIQYALANSEIIDAVYVSTDDETVKSIALANGAKVIDRPATISGDFEPTVSALKHVLESIDVRIENVILLQPTNPLRPHNLLKDAFDGYRKGDYDCLFTVSRNYQKLGKIIENKFQPFNYTIGQRSQDLEPLFFENGLLYITKASLILENIIISENAFPLEVNHIFANVDIDTPEDLEYAEYLYQKHITHFMNPYIEIAERKIGPDFPPLVIAEIGINHEGSLQVAKEMVDAAHRAGVEVVKHQTHIVEDEMSGAAKKVIPGNADVSIYEIMERCSLNEADELELKNYVESKGMIFISTPFSRAAAERLKKFDIPAYKIGSGECNNYPLLEHIASFGKPIILSTGMNTIESIRKAVAIFDKHKVPVALLHTTNLYPTPIHLVRFGAMIEIHEAFPDKVFGLSDHTLNNNACLGAVALGASILERHFTDHIQRTGPDIVCSMDESACQELIVSSAEIAQMRGGSKKPAKEEQVTIDFAFATVCTIADIKKGERFTKKNIWVKRPGTGEIPAEKFNSIIGRKAVKDINNDQQLKITDVV